MLKDKYEISNIAIDAVIFTIRNNKLSVFLKQREKEPFKGRLELVGGLLRDDETAEETLKRKILEHVHQTSQNQMFFKQFHTFTQVDRDPRSRVISIGYLALVNEDKIMQSDSWFPIKDLPTLAFDHNKIVKDAHTYLKENIGTEIIQSLMPKRFPLNNLQKIYEIIEEKEYDNRNFRRSMIAKELVVETKEILQGCSHRPPKLYMLKK